MHSSPDFFDDLCLHYLELFIREVAYLLIKTDLVFLLGLCLFPLFETHFSLISFFLILFSFIYIYGWLCFLMLEKGPYAGNTLGAQHQSPIKALGCPLYGSVGPSVVEG